MTGRIQIVRPDGGTTMLPEDCRIVIGQDMVDRARRDVSGDDMSDDTIRDHLDVAINGRPPEEEPFISNEMLVAGATAMGLTVIKREHLDYCERVYRAMDAARPKAEMILTRVITCLLLVVLVRLVDHAWRDFSLGAAEMVMTGAVLGAMIIGVAAIDLLVVPKNVEKK